MVKGFLERRNAGVQKPQHKRRPKNPKREMTFLEHLDEFRGRLIISAVVIVATTILGGVFLGDPALKLLMKPLTGINELKDTEIVPEFTVAANGTVTLANLKLVQATKTSGTLTLVRDQIRIFLPGEKDPLQIGPKRAQGIFTKPMGPFVLIIKIAIILGIVFAMPVWLWQVWLFVAPALTTAERRVVRPVLASGIFLFPLGAAFAYGMLYFVMPVMYGYSSSIKDATFMPDMMYYLSFALNFMIAFGIVFEMPLALLLAVQIGIISTAALRKSRSFIVVGMFVVAAVMTPPDPFSLLAMAIPMLALFELSLWIARGMELRKEAAERREAAREAAASES